MPLISWSATRRSHSFATGVVVGFVTRTRNKYIFPRTAGVEEREPGIVGAMEIVASLPRPKQVALVEGGNRMYCVTGAGKEVTERPSGEYVEPSPMCTSQPRGTSKPGGARTSTARSGGRSSAGSNANTTQEGLARCLSIRPVAASTCSSTSSAWGINLAGARADAALVASASCARAPSRNVLTRNCPTWLRLRGFLTYTVAE
mmetsp:Transcript_84762/g.258819  ORF Transcript_84762/g.258819 Transcript_84762/m.258819 type:complete len:203 (+) Transcript_84762:568-1176(+)